MSSADFVVEFDHVSKAYKRAFRQPRLIQAVNDVSFGIRPGVVFGLLGPNRAGKTTLVKLLLSLCRPTSGRVTRLGRPPEDHSTLARIGYVHENQAFPRYLTADTLLHYYGAMTGLSTAFLAERVPRLLKEVGLTDRSREPISSFSKGMVQRLALAQALLNEPDLLVLDEPTEGLDLEGRRLAHGIIAEQRRQGRTVILVSHVLPYIEELCDEVAILQNGRLAHVGRLADLTRDPVTGATRPLAAALDELLAKAQP
jgi:ABC-2 type transport system ATP-binding protein